ncbi:MAG: beta-hydroxyacyl-ACP dehydratase [Phycisphaerales bacterium]
MIELRPRERLVAVKNISLAEEHLHDHFAAEPSRDGGNGRPAMPIMPASLMLEGMAQTAGVLVGHAEEFRQKVILAKINRAEITRDAGPGMTLRYTATIQRMDEMGASTIGTIELLDHARAERGYVPIGTVEMMFSHLDNNMGGAGAPGEEFPAHNFVFGDAFKMLLRTSGVAIPGE